MRRPSLSAAVFVVFLAACGDDGGGASGTPAASDADGDGLPDTEEVTWGTSPVLADTDGDGYSDLEEVVQYGFDPLHNNYKFNPLVSDLPKLGITFRTLPKITLLFGEGTAKSKELSTSHERGVSESSSTTKSTSNSVASEFSQTVGAEVTASVEVGTGGVSGSASVSANYSATWSTTSEQTVSYSSEQTQESSQTWTEGQAYATSNNVEFSGGTIAIAADVVNEGNLAFELQSLALGVVTVSPAGERTLDPVGNLTYDGAQFPAMTLGPGQASTTLVFTKKDLDLGTAQALLADSTGLMVRISSYELADRAGLGFNHRLTEVNARTAQVVVDYGGRDDLPVERFNVATNSAPDALQITAARALEILRIPHELDASRRLAKVRDLGTDPAIRRYWNVIHVTNDGVRQTIRTLRESSSYDFDALTLQSGDVLHLLLMEDADADGIGMRQEFAYGTREDSPDLDSDGLSDKDEATLYGLNPQRSDTDLDGKRDSSEVFAQLAHGGTSVYAIAADETVWRWGRVEVGGAGACSGEACDPLPVKVAFPAGAPTAFAAVAASSSAAFAIGKDGSLWSWGVNFWGPLGQPNRFVNYPTPTRVGAGTSWASVSAGNAHTLALTTDGTLFGWGQAFFGQLGVTSGPTLIPCNAVTQTCTTSPVQIGAAGEWAAVWAGGDSSLALKKDGSLWAWGDNRQGQLGVGKAAGQFVFAPTQVGADTDWATASVSLNHALAVKKGGSLWSWGSNTSSELGHDTAESCDLTSPPSAPLLVPCSATPVRVGAGTDWKAVAAGLGTSYATRTTENVWTWGDNSHGQAGYGVTGGGFDRPGIVYNLRWRAISAGYFSVAGIDRNFRLRAWGANPNGQLGSGDLVGRNAPTLVKQ